MNLRTLFGAAVLAASSVVAQAAWVYDNLDPAASTADCLFNTTCAAQFGFGHEFAAQLFTLSSTVTMKRSRVLGLRSGGSTPSSVNYAFYADIGGLPAALRSSPVRQRSGGTLAGSFSYLETFSVSSIALGPGSYFFAVQIATSNFDDSLQEGLLASGAAETHDGGLTWALGYDNGLVGGISVAVGTAAPEPSTWAMMLLGFAGLGFAGYRASRKASGITFSRSTTSDIGEAAAGGISSCHLSELEPLNLAIRLSRVRTKKPGAENHRGADREVSAPSRSRHVGQSKRSVQPCIAAPDTWLGRRIFRGPRRPMRRRSSSEAA